MVSKGTNRHCRRKGGVMSKTGGLYMDELEKAHEIIEGLAEASQPFVDFISLMKTYIGFSGGDYSQEAKIITINNPDGPGGMNLRVSDFEKLQEALSRVAS